MFIIKKITIISEKISFEEERDKTFSYVTFLTHDSLCYVYVLFMTLIDIDILCVW